MKRSGSAATTDVAQAPSQLELRTEHGELVHIASPAVTESLRYMVARTRLSHGGDLPERVGLTSAIPGEGVTFISRTLAMVLAHDVGRRVCLVDLNWWDPSPWPGEPDPLGIAAVITGEASLAEALLPTDQAALQFLPAGTTTPSQRPVLANRPELAKILVDLSERFDNVLLDLPAVHATSEALTLAESCGNIALVVCEGVTPDTQIKDAVDELSGVNLLGVVLNRSVTKVPAFIRRRIPGA